MVKKKRVRQKGKIRLSGYFKKFSEGDRVSIVRDKGVRTRFPRRIVGKSGKINGSRGRFNLVRIKEGNKTKTFIIHPIHLKKLGVSEK